ncbi:MAG: FecR domain-containing protein [Gloeomargaritales cyanobacterium]
MALCGAALMLVNNVSAQSTKQGMATVVRIQGEARYSVGDNVWHPLVPGKTLGAGAVIQTAADSTVDLVMGPVPVQVSYPGATTASAGLATAPDPNVRGYVVYNPKVSQNVIRMFGNTVLAVDKLSVSDTGVDAVGDTELDLRAGKIFGTVKKISAMSQFEVKIPDGVAGIRGTTFTISANGTCFVLKGSVVLSFVSNGHTMTQEMSAGQKFNPQSASQPVSFLPSDKSYLGALSQMVPTFFPGSNIFVKDFTKCHVSPVQG